MSDLELGMKLPISSPAMAVEVSKAVSLKRIADVLERLEKLEITPTVFHTVQNLAWEAGRSFQQGIRTDK